MPRNITRLPSGRWQVRLSTAGGRLRRTFDTAEQARQYRDTLKLDDALRDAGLPGIVRRRPPSLLQIIETFLGAAEARQVAPATLEHYHHCVAGMRAYLADTGGEGTLADSVDDRLIGDYVRWRVGRHLGKSRVPASPVQAHKDLTILAMVYRHARIEPRWRKPPRLPTSRGGKRVLSPDELRALLGALKAGTLARTYAEAAAATGMRGIDLRQLTWQAIDWDLRTISFRAQKTGREQSIPLAGSLVAHLEPWQRTSPPPAGSEAARRGLVFHLEGRPLSRDTLRAAFRVASRRAGIDPPIEYLGLARNSVIAHLLAQGEPPYLVALLVGHADLRTTMRYARRAREPEQLREAVEKLSKTAAPPWSRPGREEK